MTPSGNETNEQTDSMTVSSDKTTKSKAERFDEDCRRGLNLAQKQLPKVVATNDKRTTDNFLVPYNEMLTNALNSANMAELMAEVHPDEKVRTLAAKCREDAAGFLSGLGRNRQLFEGFKAIDTAPLDADTKRLVKHALRDFRRAGIDKDDATRARLKEIDDKLTKLANEFSKNVRNDVRSIQVKPEELTGMPADWIAQHPVDKNGLVKITTDYPDYKPFDSFADNGARRRELYLLFKSRGDKSNEPILRNVLVLRAEKAKLLGYANWADYITEDKMVGSGNNAAAFIGKVIRSAQRKAKRDYRELLALKRSKIDRKATRVEDYEKTYIENLLKKKKYNFDAKELRPYLAYNAVKKGLLDTTASMYEIRYQPVIAAAATGWNKLPTISRN